MIATNKITLITIPLSTCLTTIAILLPFWWTSQTVQVGLWRARSLNALWTKVEPQLETSEGRFLYILQLLSFVTVILTDLCALVWLVNLVYQNLRSSLIFLIGQFTLAILTFFSLSIITFLVWYCNETQLVSFNLSYSFYLSIIILILHTITLISLTFNLSQYRNERYTIRPINTNEKLKAAFNEPMV